MEKDQDSGSKDTFRGYDISEINEIADEIFQLIVELNIPIQLSILGLCRAITIIGNSEDLDIACKMIDELSEIPYQDSGMADYEDVEWADDEN